MKIGICHENIVEYDAVGNDITRSAFLLVELGFVVHLIGENISDRNTINNIRALFFILILIRKGVISLI